MHYGVKRLFVFAFDATNINEAGIKDNRKYFLPKAEIKSYNVLSDETNFYDQPINNFKKYYDEVRKNSTGQGDDYTTGCLLGYAYFKDNYKLIAVGLNKRNALDADPRATQQLVFQGFAGQKLIQYIFLEKSKETVIEFFEGIAKVYK